MILTFFVVLLNKLIALDKYNKSDGKIRMKNLPFFLITHQNTIAKEKNANMRRICVCVCVCTGVRCFFRQITIV